MTSILKQNTTCFALPLCSHYRRSSAALSKGKRLIPPIHEIFMNRPMDADGKQNFTAENRIGEVVQRPGAPPATAVSASKSFGICPSRSDRTPRHAVQAGGGADAWHGAMK